MWNESGASRGDFPRVVALVQSQYVPYIFSVCYSHSLLFRVKEALRKENERPWLAVEREFLESEYSAVRDRQMKELEMEDDVMSKVPIRSVSR